MSVFATQDDDSEQAKRELRRIAEKEEYEGTPFQEMAQEWLDDLETEGDA